MTTMQPQPAPPPPPPLPERRENLLKMIKFIRPPGVEGLKFCTRLHYANQAPDAWHCRALVSKLFSDRSIHDLRWKLSRIT